MAAVLGLLALAWAIISAKQVLILILTALVLGIGLQRPVNWLERHGLRRGLALALIIASVILTVAVFAILVVPSIVRSIEGFVDEGPETLDHLKQREWVARLDERFDLSSKLEDLAGELPSQAIGVGRGLLVVVGGGLTVLVLTLYFASALPQLIEGTGRLLMPERRAQFERIAREVTDRIGGYVVGNGIVSVIAGVVTFIALIAIGVPFAAALAFWVAIADLVPSVGALIGAVAVLAVAASGGVGMFLATLVFVVVYQQVENYVIVPRVMRNTVDMSVGGVLISVLIGGALAGFPGVLLALPIAASIRAIVDELYLRERRQQVRHEYLRARLRRIRAKRGAPRVPLP